MTPAGPRRGLDLLPYNVDALPNDGLPGQDPATLFLAGDVRANENVALTALQTLWVREHNFWAELVAETFDGLDGDGIYQLARALVGAEMQAITYREFLPALLGPGALPPWEGYDPDLDPGIANVFSTAGYRFGHSMVTSELWRLGRGLAPIPAGHLPLRDGFFAPHEINHWSVGPLLRGAASQPANAIDPFVVDDLRNFLFGPPGAGGFDLAALNMQRGRDHGLPGYNAVRTAYGLPAMPDLASINPDPMIREWLEDAYDDVADVDPWVGGLAEPAVAGALVGETCRAVLAEQFRRLRDGDRFWYQGGFHSAWVKLIEQQTLITVLRRNTSIGSEIQDNPFRLPCLPGGCGLTDAVGRAGAKPAGARSAAP